MGGGEALDEPLQRPVDVVLQILLGLTQLGVLPLSFHGIEDLAEPILKLQARLRRDHPLLGFALFGFVYLIAGFG
jgi:hypothetical protein